MFIMTTLDRKHPIRLKRVSNCHCYYCLVTISQFFKILHCIEIQQQFKTIDN